MKFKDQCKKPIYRFIQILKTDFIHSRVYRVIIEKSKHTTKGLDLSNLDLKATSKRTSSKGISLTKYSLLLS